MIIELDLKNEKKSNGINGRKYGLHVLLAFAGPL